MPGFKIQSINNIYYFKGFSLIEVIIALLLLTLGFLSSAAMVSFSKICQKRIAEKEKNLYIHSSKSEIKAIQNK
jgi:prepilin-type N-terminal cleavage/methylation domain-containing protein